RPALGWHIAIDQRNQRGLSALERDRRRNAERNLRHALLCLCRADYCSFPGRVFEIPIVLKAELFHLLCHGWAGCRWWRLPDSAAPRVLLVARVLPTAPLPGGGSVRPATSTGTSGRLT